MKALRWTTTAFVLALALVVAGCAGLATPTTFNGKVAYTDGLAGALGKTCLGLSQRSRISVDTLIRCTSTVEQAGSLVDTARAVGGFAGEDRLAAAQRLLLDLEADMKRRETK